MKRIAGFLLVLSTLMVSSSAYAKTYVIHTLTCDRDKAGMDDSDVYLTLYGTVRTVREFHLDNPDRDDFERRHTDAFRLNTRDLGDITGAEVALDGDDGWCFEWISISDPSSGKVWTFSYSGFLDNDDEDPPEVTCTLESAFNGVCDPP